MNFDLKDLGNNLKMIRKSRESTIKPGKPMLQKELAELSKIPASCLCNIENGKQKNPTWNTLLKIAKALNCEVSDFFTSSKNTVSASHIALDELIDMLIKERLEKILNDKILNDKILNNIKNKKQSYTQNKLST